MEKITQQEFDELVIWLRDFKDNKLFEIDKNIENLKIKYPNEVVTFDTHKKEYVEKIQIYFDNVFNDDIFKTHGLQREINELIRYVSIVFEYLEKSTIFKLTPKQYKHLTKCRERFNSKYGMYWKFTSLNNYYKLLRPPIILK